MWPFGRCSCRDNLFTCSICPLCGRLSTTPRLSCGVGKPACRTSAWASDGVQASGVDGGVASLCRPSPVAFAELTRKAQLPEKRGVRRSENEQNSTCMRIQFLTPRADTQHKVAASADTAPNEPYVWSPSTNTPSKKPRIRFCPWTNTNTFICPWLFAIRQM